MVRRNEKEIKFTFFQENHNKAKKHIYWPAKNQTYSIRPKKKMCILLKKTLRKNKKILAKEQNEVLISL